MTFTMHCKWKELDGEISQLEQTTQTTVEKYYKNGLALSNAFKFDGFLSVPPDPTDVTSAERLIPLGQVFIWVSVDFTEEEVSQGAA